MSPDAETFERDLFAKFRGDFTFYAPRALRIRTKAGQIRPFRLNSAQLALHAAIEEQKRETGRVRVLVLKGRQQGISTYTQGRFFWRVTHERGFRAFILTHLDDATANLFNMTARFYENAPPELKPALGASNAKELAFPRLDSGYKVGTAGSRGVGRSDTFQLFHGSEVALWLNAAEHIAGAMQAVSDAPGTEVILESTSQGPEGVFYDRCMAALRGETDYRLVFLTWFMQQEYRRPVPPGFAMDGEEAEYAARYGLEPEQIAWRRGKIRELGGAHHFRREYPATVEEAFRVDVVGALWRLADFERSGFRVNEPPEMRRVVVAVDPSGGSGASNDEVGIVVVGLGEDGRGYVLADASGRMSPQTWGRRVADLYATFGADRVVAEKNFGGDMVEANLRAVAPRLSYKAVTASRGKQQRAEPVVALYEQGLVSHRGMLPALEDEMVSWIPGSKRSPNRVDALVWALTELMLQDVGSYDRSLAWVGAAGPIIQPRA